MHSFLDESSFVCLVEFKRVQVSRVVLRTSFETIKCMYSQIVKREGMRLCAYLCTYVLVV